MPKTIQKLELCTYLGGDHAHVLLGVEVGLLVHVVGLAGDLLEVARDVVEVGVPLGVLQNLLRLLLQEANLLSDH